MTIVPQAGTTSNYEYFPAFLSEPTHTTTRGTGYKRTLEYREWRNRAAAAMFDAGYEDDALDFLNCAEIPYSLISSSTKDLPKNAATVWVCDTRNEHDAMCFLNTCDGRYCPDCAHRQVARFARRYVPAVLASAKKKGHDRLRKIVLTTPLDLRDPACNRKLREYGTALGKLWKLLEKKNGNWSTAGTLEAFEFGPGGLKLHAHVYHYGRYLPKNEISKAWYELTGGQAYIVDVQSIAQDADATDEEIANEVLETLKYSVKFWSRDKDGKIAYIEPELMPLLIKALKGTRRVRSRGCFYRIPEVAKEPLCCETCGDEMLRVGVAFFPIWQETGFTPKEYRAQVERNALDLILANKSQNRGGGANKSPPKQSSFLPEFGIPGRDDHYIIDESKHRKAF